MIGTPNHLHMRHLGLAMAAGYPIFAEKPIVRTVEETYALARALAEPGRPPLFIGLVMRSMPIVREVIRRVDSGALGRSSPSTPPSTCRWSTAPIWPATGGARSSGAELPAGQGVPRLRYLRADRGRQARQGGELRRAARVHLRAGGRGPDL
uniref:Gfo/Idh/MocA family oxidoreductase n=1 Tax=Phenylobacterium glaciei TaxID=2803784 RepID=A0A974P0L8_9CAUL|nr:Gfo/Idh/MocA family oxidoreductase [Phenylobacterium glaciei]